MKIKTTLKAFPRDEMIQRIFNNEIFIYPTDTIYGIGCNALDELAVQKIRLIKGRDDKPFSVIAPSFDWIYENCDVDVDLKKYLPWPYTIILKKKNPKFLSWVSGTDSLGIRIPQHEFTTIIQKARVPFITTSVNLSGEKPITEISELPQKIDKEADVIIDDGVLSGKPSTLIVEGKEISRK